MSVTSISKNEIVELLLLRGTEQSELHRQASLKRRETVSDRIYIRALIEFSNICTNDCLYCGIRKSNNKINRYELSAMEISHTADLAAEAGMSSIVLQSGERNDRAFISYVSDVLETIKGRHPSIVITLSSGEQKKEVYREFFESGASRYLLRIETSDKSHYRKLHPDTMSYDNRLRCLHDLRDIGFQVGSGVMINSPFQTPENLAEDILFFKSIDIDMCGMGPFIPHSDTRFGSIEYSPEESFNTGLNMIAVLRLVMPDINIASTTALETLSPDGREMGLMAGANVVMPQFSPFQNRKDYMLYDNKPVGVLPGKELISGIKDRIRGLGFIPETDDPGIPLHFQRRT